MVIKNYKIWENRGDGVEDDDRQYSYTDKTTQKPPVKIHIISIPSGEVININNINDLTEFNNLRLINYYKTYKGVKLECFCCSDENSSKIKYLVEDFENKRKNAESYMSIAREFREKIQKVTNKEYVIAHNGMSKIFTAIIPELNEISSKVEESLNSLCIRMSAKYPKYTFQKRVRNISTIKVEYLKKGD